jgi:hypothetical protein
MIRSVCWSKGELLVPVTNLKRFVTTSRTIVQLHVIHDNQLNPVIHEISVLHHNIFVYSYVKLTEFYSTTVCM